MVLFLILYPSTITGIVVISTPHGIRRHSYYIEGQWILAVNVSFFRMTFTALQKKSI